MNMQRHELMIIIVIVIVMIIIMIMIIMIMIIMIIIIIIIIIIPSHSLLPMTLGPVALYFLLPYLLWLWSYGHMLRGLLFSSLFPFLPIQF